jgi:hypothetical protein
MWDAADRSPSMARERQWGRAASGEGLSLAIAEAGRDAAAGLVCLLHRQQPGVVGLGYWIVASRRRRGLAHRSVELLSRWALGLAAVRSRSGVLPVRGPGIGDAVAGCSGTDCSDMGAVAFVGRTRALEVRRYD